MAWSLRNLVAAAAVLPTLAAVPASAQTPQPQRTPPAKPERALAGLPVYTSDGKMIGRVIATGLDENDAPVLVAEIERSLGFGPTAVAVPVDMFVRKADRVELTLSEVEVNAKLGRTQRKR